jgi:hypothetical protein
VVLQAALQDSVSLDPFSRSTRWPDPVRSRRRRGQVAQAFMVAPVIVVLDEGLDLGLEVAGK